MKRLVVVDTTVWSNFAGIGRPGLVPRAFPSAAAPPEVVQEVQEGHRRGRLGSFDGSALEVLLLTEEETAEAERLKEDLGAGEAACLALARFRAALLLTDDRAARRRARAMAIPVSGTLGVLVRLVALEELSEDQANGLLRRMIELGYRSPVASLPLPPSG